MIANDASRVDESFEQLVSNDNDDGDDEVIPATQDVLSQQSVDDLDNSSSIIDCDKTEFSFDSNVTNTILTAIKQRPSMDQSQPNMTVVSISSDEGQETLTTDQIKEDTVVLNSEDLFAEECDEQQDIVEVKAEQSSIVIAAENGEFWRFSDIAFQTEHLQLKFLNKLYFGIHYLFRFVSSS